MDYLKRKELIIRKMGKRYTGKPTRTSTPLSVGGLVTPYQGLPDRKIRLRINALIDGQPICEVDFSANHLRLSLAVIAGEDAGDTPYEDIGELAGNIERQRIKNYIIRAMGADSRDGARGACLGEGITPRQFDVIEAAVLKRYPKSAYTQALALTRRV